MKIKKVNENTIKCILTEDDLNEYNIEMKDFFGDTDRLHDFVDKIIRRAIDELDYKPKGEDLSIQVMPLPENNVIIIFSDQKDYNISSNIVECIDEAMKNLKGNQFKTDKIMHEIVGSDSEGICIRSLNDKEIEQYESEDSKNKKEDDSFKKCKKNIPEIGMLVYEFESLEAVGEFSISIDEKMNVKSDMYRNEETGKCYLFLEKGRMSKANYKSICNRVAEFGKLLVNDKVILAHIKEHYKLIIEKNAISTLRKIYL